MALHAICVQIFRHIAQKSDNAPYAQALCGIAITERKMIQMRRCTRAAALLTAVCLGVSALPPVSVSAADFSANYAEALQTSMYFYE